MEPYSQMVDIRLGYDTDINFENYDLMTTTGVDYIEIELYKLLISEPGDWKLSQNIGCTPNIFTGEKNDRVTGRKIENYLIEGLKKTVYPGQVNVRVVPTGYDTLLIFVDITLPNFEIDSIPFEFDFINGIKKFNKIDSRVTTPISSVNYKVNDISNMKKPNKYWKQTRDDYLSR
jgi:hypothetical protein